MHPFSKDSCDIVAVGRRRDGGTRYWCQSHKADAAAKYGRPAEACSKPSRRSAGPETFQLDVDMYRGGIALWGAVPPVYNSTRRPPETGIHVHARKLGTKEKEIDATFSGVRLVGRDLPSRGLDIRDVDAIHYMISSVFDLKLKQIRCTHCGEPHLDQDWFSVHGHRRHLCGSCGRTFTDTARGVGNPICGLREAFGVKPSSRCSANRRSEIRQAEFLGGIQIWGSSPALIWTGAAAEEEGIHVHAFRNDQDEEEIDNTYSELVIDGISIDPQMVRVFMAQSALPYLHGRVKTLTCKQCGHALFDDGVSAFSPASGHDCEICGSVVKSSGRLRKIVANPLPGVLAKVSLKALRLPQSLNSLNLG